MLKLPQAGVSVGMNQYLDACPMGRLGQPEEVCPFDVPYFRFIKADSRPDCRRDCFSVLANESIRQRRGY